MAQTALTTPPGRKAEPLELADMQGLVARAYGHLPFARYIIGRFGDPAAARAWLAGIARDVCTADQPEDDGPSLNIAFSWDGLRRLGLADDALASFPRPLQEGMVTPHRSRILGDLHDGVGPVLAGLSMRVQAELRRDPTPLLDALAKELADCRSDLRRIVSCVRLQQ